MMYFEIKWGNYLLVCYHAIPFQNEGVANVTSKSVGLVKFWQDLEISEAFLISLEVSFFHGLFLLF